MRILELLNLIRRPHNFKEVTDPLKIGFCVRHNLVGLAAIRLGRVNSLQMVTAGTISTCQSTADIHLASILLSDTTEKRICVCQA